MSYVWPGFSAFDLAIVFIMKDGDVYDRPGDSWLMTRLRALPMNEQMGFWSAVEAHGYFDDYEETMLEIRKRCFPWQFEDQRSIDLRTKAWP